MSFATWKKWIFSGHKADEERGSQRNTRGRGKASGVQTPGFSLFPNPGIVPAMGFPGHQVDMVGFSLRACVSSSFMAEAEWHPRHSPSDLSPWSSVYKGVC